MDPFSHGAVTAPRSRSRPRPRSLRSGAFFLALVAAVAGAPLAPVGVAAQEPEPDSVRAGPAGPGEPAPAAGREGRAGAGASAQDTAAPDTVMPPPENLPALGKRAPVGWAGGAWEWHRQDLLRLPDLSLLDLLERIPGMVPVRADITNQPEAAAVFGLGGGAIRYVLDGFVLDPLTSPTFDPSRISLLALERVRVERGVTGATVRLETLTPDDARTKSVIEAATGDYRVNLFRGIFLPPRVMGGALGLGFERLSADGFTPGGSNHNVTWVKWTWARDSAGVQVEYRQSTMARQGVGPAFDGTRSDWAVRARKALGPVTGEAYVGATSVENQVGEDVNVPIREGTPQGGLRVASVLPGPVPAYMQAAVRFRDHPRLPDQEVEAALEAQLLPGITVAGEAAHGWWPGGEPTGRWSARAVLGPLLGFRAFGEVFRGGPLVGSGPEVALPAPDDSLPFRASRDGERVGLAFEGLGFALGGAAIRVAADTLHGFGLPFEPRSPRRAVREARGVEAHARIPTGLEPLTLQGWYVGMDAPGWLYLPRHHWRAALVYHQLPLPSDKLELFARVEHVFRGAMSVPAAAGATDPIQRSDAYRATNLELTIRVLTVRAFLRWENLTHRLNQADLPGYEFPGQRILWGVKWIFWN